MLLIATHLNDTLSKGIGLFCSDSISNGTIIWKFDSKFDRELNIDDISQINACALQFLKTYGSHISNEIWHVCLDNARFINHSENANICFSTDESGNVIGFAVRNIERDEELTANYTDFDMIVNSIYLRMHREQDFEERGSGTRSIPLRSGSA